MAREISLVFGPGALLELGMSGEIGLDEGIDRAGRFERLLGRFGILTAGDLTQIGNSLLARRVELEDVRPAERHSSLATADPVRANERSAAGWINSHAEAGEVRIPVNALLISGSHVGKGLDDILAQGFGWHRLSVR